MVGQLIVVVIVVAPDRGLFQSAVHVLNLAVGPGMLWLCQAVIDVRLCAGQLECMSPEKLASCQALFELLCHRAYVGGRSEVGAVVCEHGVDLLGNRSDERPQEVRSPGPRRIFMQLREREL